VYRNNRNGIKLWRGGDITNSLIYDNGADAAVVFARGGTYRVLNSVIALHNLRSGLRSYSLVAGYDYQAEPINLTLANTALCGNTGGIFTSPATTVERSGTIEASTTPCADFGFRNDFTYDAGARMTNGGTPVVNLPPGDMNGNARSLGASVDIGPRELF
ncbi:MAG: hypothetical protein Q7S89_00700, partial [bacterium]|nr:hypothetical protein [bacterium]